LNPSEPPGRICTWDELRTLEAGGISVQSHAASHTTFSELSLEARVAELQTSKLALERELGTPTKLWSYPFGDAGPEQDSLEERAADLGYLAACLYPGGTVTLPVDNPFRLSRIAMGPDTDLEALLGG